MFSRLLYLFIALVLTTSLAKAQKLVFTPQWIPQSQFAGYYAALENGYYREAGINLFMSGAVDATVAMSYNEYLSILETDKQLQPSQILRLSDLGYNIPEDGVYVTERFYNQNKVELAKFVKATKRGWLWVRENKEKAIDRVMAVAQKQKVPTNRYHQQMMLAEILELQCKKGENTPSFSLSKNDYEQAYKLLLKIEAMGTKSVRSVTQFLDICSFAKASMFLSLVLTKRSLKLNTLVTDSMRTCS